MSCQVMENDADAKIVHIIPVVTRVNGTEIDERGAGGGRGDLDQREELETGNTAEIGELMKLCESSIQDEVLCAKVLALLQESLLKENGNLEVRLQTHKQDHGCQEDLSLSNLVSALSSRVSSHQITKRPQPRAIRFPYSRHSSYSELCELLASFRPSDVHPCTVDYERWTPEVSMRNLFGEFCCNDVFRHDAQMTIAYEIRRKTMRDNKRKRPRSQSDTDASGDNAHTPHLPRLNEPLSPEPNGDTCEVDNRVTQSLTPDHTKDKFTKLGKINMDRLSDAANTVILERPECSSVTFDFVAADRPISTIAPSAATEDVLDSNRSLDSQDGKERYTPRPRLPVPFNQRSKLSHKELAYNAALGHGLTWNDYSGLVSTRRKADQEEQEL